MEVIVLGSLSVMALLLWLSGHRFGRVIAFLVLAPVMGLLIGGLTPAPAGQNYNWLGLVVGIVLAIPASGLPIYYQSWQNGRRGYRRY
ncbi:MAG TPA: hypothetical protein VNW90_27875 [Acetobacteraceae bacterium]|nr:hypothetical protein [Acetobacteraceae bacterium]